MLAELTARILSFWAFTRAFTLKIFWSDWMKTFSTASCISCNIVLVLSSRFFFDGFKIDCRCHLLYGFKRKQSLTNLPIVLPDGGRTYAILHIVHRRVSDPVLWTMSTKILIRTLSVPPGMCLGDVVPVSLWPFMALYSDFRNIPTGFEVYVLCDRPAWPPQCDTSYSFYIKGSQFSKTEQITVTAFANSRQNTRQIVCWSAWIFICATSLNSIGNSFCATM